MSYYGAIRNTPDQSNSLSSADVTLVLRQNPHNALVTPESKEKARKPIDPPPIVQLMINSDKHRNWLVNPFLFMNAVLVGTEDGAGGQPKTLQGNQLLGQNVSSLHRLKDVDNKDGGFFVFGDISCRKVGAYRLQFNLFNYEKDEVNFLSCAVSEPFRVMTAKEYPGLQESTHLSRTFSDQGVRLRLRKENRSGGVKRTFTAASEISGVPEARSTSSMYSGGPVHSYPSGHQERAYIKRQRSDSDYASSQSYPAYAGSAMQQYGLPTHTAYGQQSTQTSQTNQQPQGVGMMGSTQPGMVSGWQRPQAPYSAPAGSNMSMGGGSYFGSAASGAQLPRTLGYSQQASPQYASRGSGELYSGMSSLPTPVSEQSMGSTQSSFGGYVQPGQSINTLPSRGHPVQQYDVANHSSQYPPQPATYAQPAQAYPAPSNLTYDPHPAANRSKNEEAGYGDSPNLYNAPSQSTYPGPEHFTSSEVPLSSAMLNRGYTGAYQPQQPQGQEPGVYGEMPEHDLAAYQTKSQPASYPTPHQTSPSQLRDPG